MVAGMPETPKHGLDVRDKPALLHRLMTELAGDARISLEGDLSHCRFSAELVLTLDETGILKRNTIFPEQDFIVLYPKPESVALILKQVLAAGLSRAIIHVQIERNGILELGAYDNFDPECVLTGPGVSRALLDELKSKHIVREFEALTPKK
jgi:hypothetical protein